MLDHADHAATTRQHEQDHILRVTSYTEQGYVLSEDLDHEVRAVDLSDVVYIYLQSGHPGRHPRLGPILLVPSAHLNEKGGGKKKQNRFFMDRST